MRWSKPDEHLPGCWVPENEADAEELELRQEEEEEEERQPNRTASTLRAMTFITT